jgi:hypothetical protein
VDEGVGDATVAKVRNVLAPYRPLRLSLSAASRVRSYPSSRLALTPYRSVAEAENVEIRLHQTALYTSIYRADDRLFVNQYTYGATAAHAGIAHP